MDNNVDLIFDPGDGGVFYNSAFGGDTAASINTAIMTTSMFAHTAFDTFVTIGAASNAAVNGGPQAGIFDPDGEFNGFAGPVSCQNCGWLLWSSSGGVYANPTGNSSHRVLIGQFTLERGSDFYAQVRPGSAQQIELYQTSPGAPHPSVPAPGALAMFITITAFNPGRRRRPRCPRCPRRE